MYQLEDTIVAISSPASDHHVIIRMTGPKTIGVLKRIFDFSVSLDRPGLFAGTVAVDEELRVDAKLYLFLSPHSYTGEDVAEIHLDTNASVTEAVVGRLLDEQLRPAGPGEFTARAYLNGKIDLSQAEAVNEIITCSNRFQLNAAQKVLSGRLSQTTAKACDDILNCLSLLEAGLDFSGEDIEFISPGQAVERIEGIKGELERLLSGSISFEQVADLPSVGIAGAPNAGKSSLLNTLTGGQRSIVSEQRKTTRDVLTGLLTLKHTRCVIFDCAGLVLQPDNILDELAQRAAVEALNHALVVIFCVDVSKEDFSEDVAIHNLIEAQNVIPVATKSDLLPKPELNLRLAGLDELFNIEFFAINVNNGITMELLRKKIDERILNTQYPEPGKQVSSISAVLGTPDGGRLTAEHQATSIALTARHKQAVTEATSNLAGAVAELKTANDEVAAMMLRAAHQQLCGIESQYIDEEILGRIFGRFCIGK